MIDILIFFFWVKSWSFSREPNRTEEIRKEKRRDLLWSRSWGFVEHEARGERRGGDLLRSPLTWRRCNLENRTTSWIWALRSSNRLVLEFEASALMVQIFESSWNLGSSENRRGFVFSFSFSFFNEREIKL